MKIFFKTAIVLLILLTIYSCDPSTCGTAFIENQSSGNVYMEYDSTNIDTIVAGEVKTVGPVCGLGIGQTPSAMIYYRSIRNDDTFCRRDIRYDSNWTTIKIEKYKWEHRFTITDADFR